MKSDTVTANPTPGDTILLLRRDATAVDPIMRLFENAGFSVDSCIGPLADVEIASYGAIVHLARTEEGLLNHLGHLRDEITDEEWVLVKGNGEDDYHCTVQLTVHASTDLRQFVRCLWAQATVT